VLNTVLNWDGAGQGCQQLNENAHLVVISDADEQSAIESVISADKGQCPLLVHSQVTIIFVVSVCLCVCLFACAEFFQPSSIRLGSNQDTCYMSGSSCVP